MKFVRKHIIGLLLVSGPVVVAAILWWLGHLTTTLEFSREEIQERAQAFLEKNGHLGDTMEFSKPEVTLEGGDRVGLKVDLRVKAFGLNGVGTLTTSGRISYRPDEATFYLGELKVTEVSVAGIPALLTKKVTEYVQGVLDKIDPTIPVYTIKERTLLERSSKLMLKQVEIKPGRLIATVGY